MSNYNKDFLKRLFLKKHELNILTFSYLLKIKNLKNKERYLLYLNLNKLNLKFFINNHCLLTKNNISVNRFSYLTRSNFKNLISCGYINNINKSTW